MVPKGATNLLPELFNGCWLPNGVGCHDVFERSIDDRQRERVPLDDKRTKLEKKASHHAIFVIQNARCKMQKRRDVLSLHFEFCILHYKGVSS